MNKSYETINEIPKYLAGLEQKNTELIFSNLSLNENRLGASKLAEKAFRKASKNIWEYPDGSQNHLKNAIGKHFGVDSNRVVCGAGADEIISLLTQLFVHPAGEVLVPEFSFIMFAINAYRAGANYIETKTKNFVPSVESLTQSITDKTCAIFIANPNNPTGTYLPRKSIRLLAEKVPENVPLIIDEAYAEYVNDPEFSDSVSLLDEFPNLVVIRTFSKIYGLASLRIGWCASSMKIVDKIERLRGPYNISGPAQASAIAALEDHDYIKSSRLHNQKSYDYITSIFKKIGIRFIPSGGNFLMVIFPNEIIANQAYEYLRKSGILTRRLQDYRLPHCLRITIGNDSDNKRLIQGLREFVSINPYAIKNNHSKI